MGWLSMEGWSPYVAGIGIGVLSWLAFLLSDKPIGCSTAFVRTSGMIERLFRGSRALERPYYRKFIPTVDWEWMLVLGIVIGAFLSARLSGQSELQWVPAKWAESFGSGPPTRLLVALVGGVVMGVGARWAGGCTPGSPDPRSPETGSCWESCGSAESTRARRPRPPPPGLPR